MHNSTLDNPDFGPLPKRDSDYFHFTPLFADTVLSVIPTTLVLGASIIRIFKLWGERSRLKGQALQYVKVLFLCVYACLQLTLSICWATRASSASWSAVLAVNLSFASAVAFIVLSYLDHARSIRPSSILLFYLFFSVGLDVLHIRAPWPSFAQPVIVELAVASVTVKVICLILEAIEKARYLPRDFHLHRPEELSSILNRGIFFWLNRLMKAGARSVLVPSVLYKLDQRLSAEHLTSSFTRSWQGIKPKHQNYVIVRALFVTLKWQAAKAVIPRLILAALTVCQPLLVQKILQFLQRSSSAEFTDQGRDLIVAYSLTFFGMAIFSGFYWHSHYRLLSMIRGCLVGALNWQVAKIDIRSAADPKEILTLMSADIDRVTEGLKDLHEFWANTIQIVAVTYLLWVQIGFAALAPIVVAGIATTAVIFTSKATGPRQKQWMEIVSQRVSLTSSILSSIKEVKMKGLSGTLTQMTQDLRMKELQFAARARVLVIITNIFAWAPDLASPAATFAVFYLQARTSRTTFDSAKAFTSLSLIILLAQQLKRSFIGLPPFFAAIACLHRIEHFMCAEEHKDLREVSSLPVHVPTTGAELDGGVQMSTFNRFDTSGALHSSTSTDTAIRIIDGTFGWTCDRDILRNINATFPACKLTCVIGPVASGKSTLCKALLGEVRASAGKVDVIPRLSGIAFCDQTAHLTNQSIKQNIVGFAPYEQSWYDTVIKSVGLEEDMSILSNKDHTIIGTGGSNLSGGQRQKVAFARALYSRKRILVLDDIFSGFDANSVKYIVHHVLGRYGLARKHNMTVILATHTVHLISLADHIIVLNESGRVVVEGTLPEVHRQSTFMQNLNVVERTESGMKPQEDSQSAQAYQGVPANVVPTTTVQDRSRQTGDFAVYRFYFNAAGVMSVLLLCLIAVGFSASYNTPTLWLKAWADTATTEQGPGKPIYPVIYACLQVLGLVFLGGLFMQALLVIVTKAGKTLHDISLRTIMSAPLSILSKTDVGALTNRFSQDMNLIDVQLAFGVLYLPGVVSLATGQAIVIAISSPWVTITFPFMLTTLYFVQKFYLRTSRQLRLLAIEAKSPLYTHFLETVKGLATLRAFQWTQETFQVGQDLLDESQRPLYLLYMIRRWLIFVLDILVACLATVVAAVAVTQRLDSGFAGVALSQLVSFSQTLSFIIIDWTDVETSIGAVSRIKSFSESTPSENRSCEIEELPDSWPNEGSIEFRHVSSTYDENIDSQLTLREVSLVIHPGERVGICGRSGSGKSSTILTLLRMLEITDGAILIDNVDLSTSSRDMIRSRLNTLPQHPIFLRGTVRMNLDPALTCTDIELVRALEKVGLKDALLEERDGCSIDSDFKPENLSQGQRQLFALAGAILRKSKVVILDEVTSDVDSATDAIMQRIIREEFAGCTIIAVAHRLNTIADFDRVVVMSNGRFVEVGKPSNLLQKEGSVFRSMRSYESIKSEGMQRADEAAVVVTEETDHV